MKILLQRIPVLLLLMILAVSAPAQFQIVTTQVRVDSTAGVPNLEVGDIFDLNFSIDLAGPNNFGTLDFYYGNAAIAAANVTMTRSGLNAGIWDPLNAPPYAVTVQANSDPSSQHMVFDFRAGVGNQPVPGFTYLGIALEYFSSTRSDLIMPSTTTGAPLSTFLSSSGVDFSGFNYGSGWLYFAQGGSMPQAAVTVLSTSSFTVVPEPSTYAMLAGVAALGLVVWRRRMTPRLA
jgi:hypothetical protein